MVLTNIIKNLQAMVGAGQTQVTTGFPKTLTKNDLIGSDTVSLEANKEVIVGEYTVNPQTMVRLGYGNPNQPYNQGTIYMSLYDNSTTPVELDDNTEIRLLITDYNGRVKGVALAERYANLKSGATDLTARFKFPEQPINANENDKIRLVIISPSAVTLSKANSKLFVSATEYWVGR